MTSASNDNARTVGNAACAICEKPVDPVYTPFCSKRCADVDLHRWLSGGYTIPAEEDDSEGTPARGADQE